MDSLNKVSYKLKSQEEYEALTGYKLESSQQYIHLNKLEDLANFIQEANDICYFALFLDFVKNLLVIHPHHRYSVH